MSRMPSDEEILAAIGRLFVERHGTWPHGRDVAAALGGAVPGLAGRLDALLEQGRVGYHCTGARRQVMLLLDPAQLDWHRDAETVRAMHEWLVDSGAAWFTFPRMQQLASEPWRWGDYYAAYLATRNNPRHQDTQRGVAV